MTIYILCGLIVLYLILVFFRIIREKHQIEGFSQSIPTSPNLRRTDLLELLARFSEITKLCLVLQII